MTAAPRPRILVAPHVRELDTALGRLRTSVVYDEFPRRVSAAGGQPLTAWPGSPDVADVLAGADGVLLIGGGDVAPERFGRSEAARGVDPVRDEFETRLVLGARERGLPLLGVCRGAQLLNVALGGTLRRVEGHRQEDDLRRPTHGIQLADGTRLATMLGAGSVEVNSFHDWAADELGEGVQASAWSDGVTEALESEGAWWALGIQWHLELLDDPVSQRVFDALVAAATRAQP